MTEPNDTAVETYERHRALVRETDKKFSMVYGAGGAGVLGAGAVVLLILWELAGMSGVLPWLLAMTSMLVGLFVLRTIVRKRQTVLRRQVESYCELNDLDRAALSNYYANEGLYPYFVSLFDDSTNDRSAS